MREIKQRSISRFARRAKQLLNLAWPPRLLDFGLVLHGLVLHRLVVLAKVDEVGTRLLLRGNTVLGRLGFGFARWNGVVRSQLLALQDRVDGSYLFSLLLG